MAIPFFILAGNFLTNGGAARRMIHFASTMVGHMYGGLGLAAVLACAMFAAISGSSVATVVAVGTIMMPAMQAAGYPKRFSAGVITTSGALGILFPPSINLVIFSIATTGMSATGPNGEPVATASVGDLFIAGVDAGPGAGAAAGHHHLVSREEVRLPAHGARDAGASAGRRSARRRGAWR